MIANGERCELGHVEARRAKRLPRKTPASPAIPNGYEMREGTQEFLREHPELTPFLEETGAKVRASFGQETALALELFQEPESSAAPVELFLLIKTPLDVPAARERLDRFGDAFWLDNMHRCDGLLHVALEFV